MKTIALIRNSYSFDFGGAERFPVNLGTELAKNGFCPVILSANATTLRSAKKAELKAVKSPWWSFQNFSGLAALLFPVYLIWQVCLIFWYLVFGMRYKIDVFHPQSRDDFIAATFTAKLLRKKVIWTDHADLKYVFANHQIWYKNPVGKLVYLASKLTNRIVLESFSEKKLIEEALGKTLPANYAIIHLGVVDSYKPVKRDSGKVVFACTSRLVKTKGIGELIEAFRSINSNKAQLKLYGDGPEAAQFKLQASIVKNVEFMGHVDDITRALQNANVFVHPSYHEGFGLSLVEAEMCSLPIIACNVGSIPEIVQDGVNGILIGPKSVEELAEAMRILANSPALRQEMGQKSRQIYLKSFQFDRIVRDSFIPLYERTTRIKNGE